MAQTATIVRRPGNMAICAIFAVLSALGLWTMRVSTAMNEVPVGFMDIIQTGVMPNGLALRKGYTGFAPLDDLLSFLVAAFLPGPTKWNESFYWQQLHFLVQIAPMIAVTTVEACRERNKGSWLKYTTIWAFLYQNVGGAVILSIWWLVFHQHSAEKSYHVHGREVNYAPLIAPSIILIYLLPTAAIFIPDLSTDILQPILAFWQTTPLLVNVPLWIASAFTSTSSSSSSSTHSRGKDLSHLKFLYIFSFALSVVIHWYTIYGVSVSENPSVSITSVFVPSANKWKSSLGDGLLWIFQWDWIICGIAAMIPCIIAMCDVQRLTYGVVTLQRVCSSTITSIALTLLGGPGATLSIVWYWREQKMAMIEEKIGGSKKGL